MRTQWPKVQYCSHQLRPRPAQAFRETEVLKLALCARSESDSDIFRLRHISVVGDKRSTAHGHYAATPRHSLFEIRLRDGAIGYKKSISLKFDVVVGRTPGGRSGAAPRDGAVGSKKSLSLNSDISDLARYCEQVRARDELRPRWSESLQGVVGVISSKMAIYLNSDAVVRGIPEGGVQSQPSYTDYEKNSYLVTSGRAGWGYGWGCKWVRRRKSRNLVMEYLAVSAFRIGVHLELAERIEVLDGRLDRGRRGRFERHDVFVIPALGVVTGRASARPRYSTLSTSSIANRLFRETLIGANLYIFLAQYILPWPQTHARARGQTSVYLPLSKYYLKPTAKPFLRYRSPGELRDDELTKGLLPNQKYEHDGQGVDRRETIDILPLKIGNRQQLDSWAPAGCFLTGPRRNIPMYLPTVSTIAVADSDIQKLSTGSS
ncbi:hypothetical protein C8R46DRAFT_1042083 [Mycena filopes]|nr:hypothetical protein C8R46DRAFT_1042083 [Mycena filopes]